MSVESPPLPTRELPPCRESFASPNAVEKQLRDALTEENLRLAQVLHEDLGNHLSGTVLCLAAARSRAAVVDPGLADRLDEIAALMDEAVQICVRATCSASAFVATRHGLAAALQLRFRNLGASSGPACEILIQDGADAGLLPDEHQVLLQIAEQAVGQARREGSTQLRVTLRRSRLGPAELSVAGEGGIPVAAEVANSGRPLAIMRHLAASIGGRLTVRRLDGGGLFVRCITRWV
jgi:signal transduction histidine kinase